MSLKDRVAIESQQPILPEDRENEDLVLGSILANPTSLLDVTDVLSTDCFTTYIRRHLFTEITKQVVEENKDSLDLARIAISVQGFKPDDILEEITKLTSLGKTVSDISFHANKANEYLIRRQGILQARKLIADLSNKNNTQVIESLDDASHELSGLGDSRKLEAGLVLPERFIEQRKFCMNERIDRGKILTGMSYIDERLSGGGFLPGKISALVGRPSSMKTTVRINWEEYWAENDIGVLALPFEPGTNDDMDRKDALITNIPLKELKNPREWQQNDPRIADVLRAQEKQKNWPIAYYDRRDITVDDLPRLIRKVRRSNVKVDIVTIDTFSKMAGVTQKDNLTESINYNLKRLSDVAVACAVHILVLTHLNRDLERRSDKRPRMSDIKQSGSYEEDMDQIFAVWRPKAYDKKLDFDFQELIILKQRDGPAGSDVSVWNSIEKEVLRLENFSDLNPYEK